jgi:hypothetical protein
LGAAFGIAAGFFGVIIGLIALPFDLIFNGWHWGWFPHFHGFLIIATIVLLAILLRKRR